jgi:hypothetical protein
MKVLLLNGSPNKEGCTYTALKEISTTLQEEGIESEIYQIVTEKDFSLVGISGHINRILDELLHLNILAIDTAYMIQQGLRLAGIEVEYADLQAVD